MVGGETVGGWVVGYWWSVSGWWSCDTPKIFVESNYFPFPGLYVSGWQPTTIIRAQENLTKAAKASVDKYSIFF